jgi:hypothetical protein
MKMALPPMARYGALMTIPNMVTNPTAETLPIVARRCIVVFAWFIFNFPLDSLGYFYIMSVYACV